ncbi:MAG: tRNA (adenosine(37)-N6)-threonylcarbamoyltransferase complex dimerization subunit type 1 TsaB [Chloroflexi bacterium]|nr:tRNA (adenosine(37)-N6)-threonylcarbamoyltransferase complex dimerization subunit type 1 TsaB [Chloroflexota bacterium]
MLLAIDTATNTPSIALFDERGVLGESTWRTHENHTRSLMPEVTRLIELVGANISRIDALGVATGPGSFTGLRIGLSAAKGLAYSLPAALLGVPTLEITASAAHEQMLPVCAVMMVGRGRFAAALYQCTKGAPLRTSDYVFGAAEGIVEQVTKFAPARFLAIGEMDASLRVLLHAALHERVVFASDALTVRRAGFLAELAWRRWRAGERDDLQTLTPYYIPTASLA